MTWDEMTDQEKDTLVAEKVMGLKVVIGKFIKIPMLSLKVPGYNFYEESIPQYTTDISAAWGIVKALEDEFEIRLFGPNRDKWGCEFTNKTTMARYSAYGERASEAICLASLKAVGVLYDT